MNAIKTAAQELMNNAQAYEASKPENSLKGLQAKVLAYECSQLLRWLETSPSRSAQALDHIRRLRLPIGLHRQAQSLVRLAQQ